MSVDDGTIFTVEIWDDQRHHRCALQCARDHSYAVRSIAALESKRFEFYGQGTDEEQIIITPLMPERAQTPEDVARVEKARP